MDHLAQRATKSLAFAPALEVYRIGKSSPETDIDILASVDGQIYIVEVKNSFAGIKPQVIKELRCLAEELSPDVVMLAVMDSSPHPDELLEIIRSFGNEHENHDVRFELLTLDQPYRSASHDRIALPLAKRMEWSSL